MRIGLWRIFRQPGRTEIRVKCILRSHDFILQVELTLSYAYPSPKDGNLPKHTPYISLRDHNHPLQPRTRTSPSKRRRKCLWTHLQLLRRGDHREPGIYHDLGLPREGNRGHREESACRAVAPSSGGWRRRRGPDAESLGVPEGVGEQVKTS